MLGHGVVLVQKPADLPRATPFSEEDTVLPPGVVSKGRQRKSKRRGGRRKRMRTGLRRSGEGLRDPLIRGLLSFFFPGVGHIIGGETAKGLWLILGAWLVVRWLHVSPFGLVMVVARLIVAWDAYRSAQQDD